MVMQGSGETARVMAEAAERMELVARHMAPRVADGRLVAPDRGVVLRFLLDLHGLDDRDTARDLGVTRSAVASVVRGYPKHRSLRIRQHLANLLGESVETLFGPLPLANVSIPAGEKGVNDNVSDRHCHARKCA